MKWQTKSDLLMFTRRDEASLLHVGVGLAFMVGCIGLYGLWVAERYLSVVGLLVLLIVASAVFNVSLNRALDGQLQSAERIDTECFRLVADDVEVESARTLMISYHDPSRSSKDVYAISLPVRPGDRLGVIVEKGHQGIVIGRNSFKSRSV